MPRPPSPSASRIAGMVRIEREEPRPAGRVPSHREDPRVVGVEDVPTLRPRDARDDALHLGELVDGVDAVQAQVVLGHVRHDGDVVVPHADAAQQHASPRRLEHRHVGLLGERARGSAEARVVAGLDQRAVVAEHAVRRRVRDRLARAPHEMRQQPDGGGLPVRPGHLDDGDRRIGDGRHVARARRRPGDAPPRRSTDRASGGATTSCPRRPRSRAPRRRRAGATGTPPRSGPARAPDARAPRAAGLRRPPRSCASGTPPSARPRGVAVRSRAARSWRRRGRRAVRRSRGSARRSRSAIRARRG